MGLIPTWLVLPLILGAAFLAETSVFIARRDAYLAARRERTAATDTEEAGAVEELDEAA